MLQKQSMYKTSSHNLLVVLIDKIYVATVTIETQRNIVLWNFGPYCRLGKTLSMKTVVHWRSFILPNLELMSSLLH